MSKNWIVTKLPCYHENKIQGITSDNNGYIYYTVEDNIYRIDGDGTTEPQLIINAKGADLRGIVWNKNILFMCDWNNHNILMYSLDTGNLSPAGNDEKGNIIDARFARPTGIAVDTNGDL